MPWRSVCYSWHHRRAVGHQGKRHIKRKKLDGAQWEIQADYTEPCSKTHMYKITHTHTYLISHMCSISWINPNYRHTADILKSFSVCFKFNSTHAAALAEHIFPHTQTKKKNNHSPPKFICLLASRETYHWRLNPKLCRTQPGAVLSYSRGDAFLIGLRCTYVISL